MSSSPNPSHPNGRVLLAEHTAGLPLASLLAPLSASAVLERSSPAHDEAALAARLHAAHEKGRQEGIEEAQTAELMLRRQLLSECASHVGEAARSISADRGAMLQQIVAESVDLAFGLIHELIGTELSLHEQPARDAVLRAIRLAPPDKDLVIRVHPDSQLVGDDFAAYVPAAGVSIIRDPAIEVTGAVVEVGACRIDAQIGPALERVREILKAQLAHHGTSR